jgi:hypothetical protein
MPYRPEYKDKQTELDDLEPDVVDQDPDNELEIDEPEVPETPEEPETPETPEVMDEVVASAEPETPEEPETPDEPPPRTDIDSKDAQIESLKKTIETMREQINTMVGGVPSQSAELQAAPETQPVQPPPADPTPPVQPQPRPNPFEQLVADSVDFLEGLEIDDVTASPEIFNTVMRNVATQAARMGAQAAMQQTLTTVTPMVGQQVNQTLALNQLRENFYNENSDLRGYPVLIQQIIEREAQATPNKPMDEFLQTVASTARAALGLPEPKKGNPQQQSRPAPETSPDPALPTSPRHTRKPASSPDAKQQELDDLTVDL